MNRNPQRQGGQQNNINIKREIKTEPIHNFRARPLKCNFCGRIGHLEQDCHFKQRHNINVLESKNWKAPVIKHPDRGGSELMRTLQL